MASYLLTCRKIQTNKQKQTVYFIVYIGLWHTQFMVIPAYFHIKFISNLRIRIVHLIVNAPFLRMNYRIICYFFVSYWAPCRCSCVAWLCGGSVPWTPLFLVDRFFHISCTLTYSSGVCMLWWNFWRKSRLFADMVCLVCCTSPLCSLVTSFMYACVYTKHCHWELINTIYNHFHMHIEISQWPIL
jgi:hypothetical protein